MARAQMALRADGRDGESVILVLLREPDGAGIVRVIERDVAVAHVTIQAEGRECARFRIDRCGVAAGAAVRELVLIPRRLFQIHPGLRLTAGSQIRARIEQREFAKSSSAIAANSIDKARGYRDS